MKLSLECRTDLLEMVQPFGDFDFILADRASQDEKYSKYYEESEPGRLKILNCESMPVDKLKILVDALKIGGIISPDWTGDYEKTVASYLECVKTFGEQRVIGVLQGNTLLQALSCLMVYKGAVAVPYRVGGATLNTHPQVEALSRALVVAHIPNDRQVHLLGFTTLGELEWYGRRTNIVSINTGVPILLGLQGLDILDPLESKGVATSEAMERHELTQSAWTAIIRNIALLRKYL